MWSSLAIGRVGKHLVDVLEALGTSLLVIEADMERISELNERGLPPCTAMRPTLRCCRTPISRQRVRWLSPRRKNPPR